jgi:hypothetical protein|tara:strand:+ start:400 stop:570 length:171 start_codon:yes stop_codon:yes gene_type:complete
MKNTEQWLSENFIAHQDEYIRTLEDTISKINIEIKILQNKIEEVSHMLNLTSSYRK